jgi:hypothetical protein
VRSKGELTQRCWPSGRRGLGPGIAGLEHWELALLVDRQPLMLYGFDLGALAKGRRMGEMGLRQACWGQRSVRGIDEAFLMRF